MSNLVSPTVPHLASFPRREFLRLATVGGALCLRRGISTLAADPSPSTPPLFSFGVVTDIHFCDHDTRSTRFYRQSIGKLSECVERFNGLRPAFVLQLGDLIDGDEASYDPILTVYNRLSMPHYHVLGNHDLRNESRRPAVLPKLGLDRLGDGKGYCHFVHAGWRFIVLDGNDMDPKERVPKTNSGSLRPQQRAWLKRTLAEAAAAGRWSPIACAAGSRPA